MLNQDVLDEEFLKELMLKELDLDIDNIETSEELTDADGTYIVRTFSNPHEAKLFQHILHKVGISARIDNDPTLGNMDPLFNTGTQMLLTREEDVKRSLEVIEVVDKYFNKEKQDVKSNATSKMAAYTLLTLIAIAGLAIAGMTQC